MNIFLWILGLLAIIAAITMYIVFANSRYKTKRYKLSTLVLITGIALFVLGNSFQILPTGYTGVRTTFGQVSDNTLSAGLHFKIPFVQSITKVNNKQQDAHFDSEIWGETSEKTPVYASDIVVTYQIAPARSAWLFANISDTDNLISQDIVASSTKAALVEFSATTVTNRAQIEPLVREKLTSSVNEKYGENTVTILKVVINQMDFEPAYNDAINQKSLALQAQERQKIENQTAIEKAEANKKVSIANAEAKAEADRIAAEAKAEVMRIEAEAEAEANRKIAESLTEDVLGNKVVEKWDGKLPVVSGENGTIINIDSLIDDSNP